MNKMDDLSSSDTDQLSDMGVFDDDEYVGSSCDGRNIKSSSKYHMSNIEKKFSHEKYMVASESTG